MLVSGPRAGGPNALHPQRQRLTISQLSQKTQISRAAVRRCFVYPRRALGMVHSPDGRSYELLPGCWPSATPIWQARRWPRWRRRRWIILAKRSANPVRRPRSTGITCSYIARAAVNNLLSIDLGRGSRLPAWATSMGRVLLSALPEEQLEVTLSRATLIRYTPHTLWRFVRFTCRDRPGAHAGLCPRRPADRGRACARWRYPCCRVTVRWWPP